MLAGASLVALCGGAAYAQTAPQPPVIPTSAGTTTIVAADGTKIETTVLGPTQMKIVISGGPEFTNNPATVNFTNISTSGLVQT